MKKVAITNFTSRNVRSSTQVVAAAAVCAIPLCVVAEVQAAPPGSGWTQSFNDDFNGTTLDTSKWITTWAGGNRNVSWSQEWMDDNNVTVENGYCRIKAYVDENKSVRSGVITSYDKQNASGPKWEQKYGYFEGRIRMNNRPGNLNAFWMANKDVWPPELDIVEQLGSSPDEVHLTQHWFDQSYERNDGSDMTHWKDVDFSQDWHTFGMYWSPSVVIWYVDGVEKKRMPNKMITSEKGELPQYLMANIHVGNTWAGYPDYNSDTKSYMDIDYIRAWTRSDYGFVPGEEHQLSRTGWTATASRGNSTANNALDNNASTAYNGGANPTYDDWFRVDMGASRTFNKIYIDNGTSPNGFPGYYTLQSSEDGSTWKDEWANSGKTNQHLYFRKTNGSYPKARYLRMKYQANGATTPWNIAEFKVYYDTGIPDGGSNPTPTPTPSPSITNLMNNPGFEAEQYWTTTPSGWSEVQFDSSWNVVSADASYSENYGGSASGNYHGTHWKSTAYRVATYQVKTGLANGLYTLRCKARSSGGQTYNWLEAKDHGDGGSKQTAWIPVSSTYQTVEIKNINITNGQCTIGVWSDANAGNSTHFDDFEFFKQ